MRKLFVIPLLGLFLFSCKKEESKQEDSAIVNKTIVKVNEWLDAQISYSTKSEIKESLKSLKSNLIPGSLWYEKLNQEEKLIIVPIGRGYKLDHNKNMNPINCLLLIETKEGKIRKGNIVQYISTHQSSQIPKGTFFKYYNSEKLEDIVLCFLSLTNNPLYEAEYKKGSIEKFSVIAQSNLPSTHSQESSNRKMDDCIDWYWQTYVNGVLVSEEYVGTICNGIYVEGGSFGEELGLGSLNDDEAEVSRVMDWTVASNPAGGSGEIISTERIKGRRKPSTWVGGYFTEIHHMGSICNFCSSQNPNDVWYETSNSSWFYNQTASSTIAGNLNYQGWFYSNIFNAHIWTFSQIFP
jgi:hypothetical protein